MHSFFYCTLAKSKVSVETMVIWQVNNNMHQVPLHRRPHQTVELWSQLNNPSSTYSNPLYRITIFPVEASLVRCFYVYLKVGF